MSEDFKIGDRVRLKAAVADTFKAPFKKFAETGRPATVNQLRRGGYVLVSFDTSRGNPRTLAIRAVHLEGITA